MPMIEVNNKDSFQKNLMTVVYNCVEALMAGKPIQLELTEKPSQKIIGAMEYCISVTFI